MASRFQYESNPFLATDVTCIECGEDTLQLLEPLLHTAADEYDPTNPLATRGSWIDVAFQCERCDEVTSWVIAFHKGQVKKKSFHRTPRTSMFLNPNYKGPIPDRPRDEMIVSRA